MLVSCQMIVEQCTFYLNLKRNFSQFTCQYPAAGRWPSTLMPLLVVSVLVAVGILLMLMMGRYPDLGSRLAAEWAINWETASYARMLGQQMLKHQVQV